MNSSGSGFTRVSQAILNGNIVLLEKLHNKGFDLNARGPDGLCPLHVAAQAGKESVVIYLLSHGVDIDASSTLNETALYFAAREGHLDVVKCLLQFGPDVNNEGNKKAVYAAVYPGRRKMIQPVNLCKEIVLYEPVPEVAAQKWLPKDGYDCKKLIFECLLDYGFVYEIAKGCEPKFFHGAVEIGLTGIVEDLLKYGADANMELDEETPLLAAIRTNQPDITDLLLLHGADFNAHDEFGNTPIYYAALTGNVKLAKSLLTLGANLSDYREIVHAAISGNSPETLEELLNRGTIDINDCTIQGITALGASLLRNNNVDLPALLLDKGANVNERSGPDHNTPLHYLSEYGDHRNCETMLKKGAQVGCKNKYGRTPLHEATTLGIVMVLLEYGADINARDCKGRTPLHIASGGFDGNALNALLQAGADMDARDNKGKTPLHLAFKSYQMRKVWLLLNYGADINICDNNNAIPGVYFINDQDNPRLISNIAMMLFISHTARLQACNLYVSEEILQCMRKTEVWRELTEGRLRDKRERCDEEIRKLQAKKIPNSNISFYQCLTQDISSLAVSLNNEHVVQGLEFDVSANEFPIYALMLKTKFRKAMERKALVDQCYEIFGFLTSELAQFPACCSEAIMHYLSNQDLQMFIVAFKATNQYPPETDSITWSDEEPLSDSSEGIHCHSLLFEIILGDDAFDVLDAFDDLDAYDLFL